MPVIENSTYRPSFFFKNKHLNTVYRTFFNKLVINYKRERIELIDGDFIDLDISSVNSDKVVVAIHGLEGSSQSTYMQSLCNLLNQNNFDVIAVNLRGCSGHPNRLFSSYHSGKTDDLEAIIQYVEAHYGYNEIHLVGYSLGGNITLKYMGEKEASISSKIKSAVGVAVPCDLKASSDKITSFANRVYLKMFLKSLREKSFQKLRQFPDSFLTKEVILSIKSFRDFDDAYTGPAHGFKDAEDYYEKSSSKQYIPTIKRPTLLITSLDDPFFSSECYPFREASQNSHFFLEATNYGGHVGYASSFDVAKNNWCENRILSFITYKE